MNRADDRSTAIEFIKKHFIKSEAKLCSQTSYTLKHLLQDSTNVYMTEADFVGLLTELGYKRSPRGKWKMWLSPELCAFLKNKERGIW